MEKDIEIFKNYVENNYDMNNKLIKLKYIHTLEVIKVIMQIGSEMNLNKDDIKLAFYLGLFHDLGRFEEVVRLNAFRNLKFDHGSYSNKILFNDGFICNFNINEKDYCVIRKAIYNHNKKNVENNLNNRELFFTNLLRDADKIDIFRVLYTDLNEELIFDDIPSVNVLKCFKNNLPVDIKDLNNYSDVVLLRLNFLKQLTYRESFSILNKLGYFDKYVSSINVLDKYSDIFNECLNDTKNYEKRMIKC